MSRTWHCGVIWGQAEQGRLVGNWEGGSGHIGGCGEGASMDSCGLPWARSRSVQCGHCFPAKVSI